jgi:hypothetical protein
MTFLDARRSHAPSISGFDDDHVTRALLACVFSMIALFVVLIGPWIVDGRLVEGVNPWTKPQKFNISLGLHFLTLAILAQFLARPIRSGPSLSIATYLAVGALMFEAAYIIVQAARGRRSHFNYETQTESLMYAMMGLGALLLVLVAIVLGVQLWRRGARASRGLRTGAVLGLILGGLLTIVLAGYMSSSGSRWVGVHPEGGAVVPFFGWSREVGDMRPAHFVTMHMMQTLPLLGWLSDRIGGPSVIIVWIAAAVQGALAIALFMQALSGLPFWPA